MDLKSPTTLAAAWVLVPALVALASAGLGAGLARIAGLQLGALTLPAGFMAGIALMTFLLEVGVRAWPTTLVCLAAALAGGIAFLRDAERPWRRRPEPWVLWAAGCGLATFAICMAPLAGGGRAGVLGYVFNNDPSVHLAVVELIRDHGARGEDVAGSSYGLVGQLFDGGYPLGSHTWLAFGSTLTNIDAFFIWSPVFALVPALTAFVAFALMRELGAPPPFAALAGAAIACGYLPFAYLVQSSVKELLLALSVYGAIALSTLAFRAGLSWRTALPAALAASAGLNAYGVGAAAWLGPAALVGAAALLLRPAAASTRRRDLVALAIGGALAGLAALPSLVSSLSFVESNRNFITDPNQVGNLLGPVPWSEAFNVWLAYDFRFPDPEYETLTAVAVVAAALLAALGLAASVRRRSPAVAMALAAGIVGALYVSARYSIYFDAKSYVVLAPALGLATAAGVLAIWRARPAVATALGVALLAGVVASDAMTYAGTWLTPRDRFQEMIDLGDRLRGQGPVLVVEREDYAKYFLRDSKPFESWGSWSPDRGLRYPIPPAPPHTPDFDDYRADFVARFPLLLERKRPGGSLPPANFEPVSESDHYRVWRRRGPAPRRHLALGLGTVSGAERLDCRRPAVERLLAAAARERRQVLVSRVGSPPVVSDPRRWEQYGAVSPGPAKGIIRRRGGFTVATAELERRGYSAWLQGSLGGGARLSVNGRRVGESFGDLQIHDAWKKLGDVRPRPGEGTLVIQGLRKPWWQSGSHVDDLNGPLALVPAAPARRLVRVDPARRSGLCGRQVDWIAIE